MIVAPKNKEAENAEPQQAEDAKEPEQTKDAPTVAELREKWTQDIIAAQERADKLDLVRAAAEASAKSAKKSHEAAVDALQDLIRRGPSTQLDLPFQESPDMTPEQKREHAWNQMLASAQIEDAITFKPKQLERLKEAGVKTMLDMENLRGGKLPDYPRGLLSVKGFGEAAVDQIEAAIMEWIETNEPIEEQPDETSLADEVADRFEKEGLLA